MPKARCAVLRQADQPYSIETVEVGETGPDEARVRIVATGWCHTDRFGRSGLLGEHFLPAVLGHEGAGVVEEVGHRVTHVSPGDHVVLSFASCGHCRACHDRTPARCSQFETLNLSGLRADGSSRMQDAKAKPLTSNWFGQSSFGESTIADGRCLVKVDPQVPLEILGPLGCAIQTGAGVVLNTLRPGPDQSLVVFGVGAVGLSAVLAARVLGLRNIVAVDLNPERRKLALELGASRALDGTNPELVAAIRQGGPGADASLDTTGLTSVMTTAIEVLRRPGAAVLVGAGLDQLSVHPAFLAGKTVTYVYEGDSDPQVFIPHLIDLYRREEFPFDRLLSHYRLDEIDTAEADALAGRVVKPVLLMEGGPA